MRWLADRDAAVFAAVLIFLMVGGSLRIMLDLHNRMTV